MTAPVNFAALPPEVNSGRMYAGSGAGPLTAAAAAWDRLAWELTSAASSYRAIISELTDGTWRGPAATAMTAAVQPYLEWMDTTGAQAAHTANQARVAAAAYQSAYSAMVPPAVIAANRASLTHLVSTNVLGQNTHLIAANQAQYAEMWSQDAVAMQGYQAHSAAAAAVTPFTPAPQEANSAQGGGGLDSINDFLIKLGDTLANLGTTGPSAQLLNFLSSTPFQLFEATSVFTTGFNAAIGGAGFNASGFSLITAVPENAALAFTIWWVASQSALSGAGGLMSSSSAVGGIGGLSSVGSASLAGSGSALAGSGLGGAPAAAGLGRAASVGGLSVPQSWTGVAPEVRVAGTALPAAGAAALPQAGMGGMPGMAGMGGMGGMGGMPVVGSVVNAPRNGDSRSRSRPGAAALAQPGRATGHSETLNQWLQRPGSDGVSVLSERDELNKLRQAAAELAKKRDALTRSAAKMIKQAKQ